MGLTRWDLVVWFLYVTGTLAVGSVVLCCIGRYLADLHEADRAARRHGSRFDDELATIRNRRKAKP